MADAVQIPDEAEVRARWGNFTWTKENEAQAKVIVARYPAGRQRSAVMPLLDLAQRRLGDNALKTFAFRGMSPAVADEPLHLVMRGQGEAIELGAFAADGRQVMSASASA
mgnify:CR=1 FL=1